MAATASAAALGNNNQVGLILQANSGLPFNIRSRADLNQDGVTNDRPRRHRAQRRPSRPRGQPRPAVLAVRSVRAARSALELFFEAKNLFNTENIAGVNRDVTTDAPAILAAPLPSPVPDAGKSGYDQRQMQLGVKFTF